MEENRLSKIWKVRIIKKKQKWKKEEDAKTEKLEEDKKKELKMEAVKRERKMGEILKEKGIRKTSTKRDINIE